MKFPVRIFKVNIIKCISLKISDIAKGREQEMTNELDKEMFKLISKYTRFDKDAIEILYMILGSFDDVLLSIYLSGITNLEPTVLANIIQTARGNIKIMFKGYEE